MPPRTPHAMARREALTAVEWGLLLGVALLALGAGKGRTLTLAEMRQLAAETGFPDPDLADYGLWQIHQAAHPQFTPWDLLDPAYNARAAFAISRGGTVWTDWVTFNKGLHLRWMPNA